jgi:hypothetical protein
MLIVFITDSSSLTIAGWIDEYGPLITIRSKLEKIIIIGRYKVGSYVLISIILAQHSVAGRCGYHGESGQVDS